MSIIHLSRDFVRESLDNNSKLLYDIYSFILGIPNQQILYKLIINNLWKFFIKLFFVHSYNSQQKFRQQYEVFILTSDYRNK